MKHFLSAIIIAAMCMALTGCYKDVINPGADPNGPPQPVSFSGDLIPLFTKNCANSGCHDATPSHNPGLTADKAYNNLLSGGFVNTILPANSPLYLAIKDGNMPIGGSLSAAEKQKVLDWIRNGAPNN